MTSCCHARTHARIQYHAHTRAQSNVSARTRFQHCASAAPRTHARTQTTHAPTKPPAPGRAARDDGGGGWRRLADIRRTGDAMVERGGVLEQRGGGERGRVRVVGVHEAGGGRLGRRHERRRVVRAVEQRRAGHRRHRVERRRHARRQDEGRAGRPERRAQLRHHAGVQHEARPVCNRRGSRTVNGRRADAPTTSSSRLHTPTGQIHNACRLESASTLPC